MSLIGAKIKWRCGWHRLYRSSLQDFSTHRATISLHYLMPWNDQPLRGPHHCGPRPLHVIAIPDLSWPASAHPILDTARPSASSSAAFGTKPCPRVTDEGEHAGPTVGDAGKTTREHKIPTKTNEEGRWQRHCILLDRKSEWRQKVANRPNASHVTEPLLLATRECNPWARIFAVLSVHSESLVPPPMVLLTSNKTGTPSPSMA
jgi:hypothetical protein